ncbi:MAG: hypothetical protein V1743_06900 [Nanoarchaeota archaeon]
MRKKGQAAMEFLMTYGWAILVVLAAIGALAYFGVLSPKNILPSSCTVGAGFGCKDSKATANGMQFSLLNNLGSDIENIEVRFSGDTSSILCATPTVANSVGTWSGGCNATECNVLYTTPLTLLRTGKSMGDIIFTQCDGDGAGGTGTKKFSGNAVTDFTITYKASGETLTHQVQGKANLKVEV